MGDSWKKVCVRSLRLSRFFIGNEKVLVIRRADIWREEKAEMAHVHLLMLAMIKLMEIRRTLTVGCFLPGLLKATKYLAFRHISIDLKLHVKCGAAHHHSCGNLFDAGGIGRLRQLVPYFIILTHCHNYSGGLPRTSALVGNDNVTPEFGDLDGPGLIREWVYVQ